MPRQGSGEPAVPTPSRSRDALRRRYRGLTCTLRHLMAPPGASLGPLPNCSATGPSTNLLSSTSTVLTPFNTTTRCGPLAVISYVFHRPPALGIGATLATLTMAPVP